MIRSNKCCSKHNQHWKVITTSLKRQRIETCMIKTIKALKNNSKNSVERTMRNPQYLKHRVVRNKTNVLHNLKRYGMDNQHERNTRTIEK